MKSCWDPKFEPSVEEIVDYLMISLWHFSRFVFSSELAFRAGGFPYSVEYVAGEGQLAQATRPNIVHVYGACAVSLAHGRWRSRPGQPAQAVRPNIRVYGACAVCRCVLVRIMVGTGVRCNTFHKG